MGSPRTTDLSRIADMIVISRNTAFTYQDKRVDTKQIGRELGVRYVLEGSVRRSGNRIRINAKLIDAETDAHLWAERFNDDASDLFALQNEITSRIAVALNLELIGAETARPTEHPDALDYILRGRSAGWRPPTPEKYAEAIDLYEHALALDPRSVAAQSGLASELAGRTMDFPNAIVGSDIKRAEGLVAKALAASPRSALAHNARGQVLRAQDRYHEAIPHYEAVLALNRNLVSALANLGWCKFWTGLLEEVIPLHEQAIRLSPRDPLVSIWHFRIGLVHLVQSRIEEAILWLEKARSANAGLTFVHAWLAAGHALNGDTGRAATELAEARRLSADDRYLSLTGARKAFVDFAVPKISALFEATYFAGLRKAGVPDE
jgi:tetratricopeptide (TPR) repeat protein